MASDIGNHAVISTNTTTQVKTGAGTLHRIVVNNIGTSWVIHVGDNTAGDVTDIANITSTVTNTMEYKIRFGTGLRITTSGTAAGNITVVYE